MAATPRVGLRSEYPVDAARSHAIHDALSPVLAETRRLTGADIGLAAYQPGTDPGECVVLASSTAGGLDAPLPSEPVRFERPLPRRVPRLCEDLRIGSPLRPYRLLLRSAMVIPWSDGAGGGVIIIGNGTDRPVTRPALDRARTRLSGRITGTLTDARRAGARRINGDLRRAIGDVAEAAVARDDVTTALSAMLISARDLFDAEVAYFSLPERDVNTFTFDQMMGIHTTEFRHLRIQMGQGLGGMARSLRQPVRSLDYASDTRLRAAPVTETVREGIVSAMATPVLIDDDVKAVLYVGNRHLRPFSELDAELLDEFAGYAALGLKRRAVERYRAGVIRRQERERLGLDLHDSVVRGLVEIGFTAEAGRAGATDPTLRGQLESIGRIAERCMEQLRDHLATLTGHDDTLTGHPATVLDRIGETSLRPAATRTIELRGHDAVLSPATADALVRIGQEALANADTHARGSRTHLSLEITATDAVLTVTDDGRGLDAAALDEVLSGAVPHLGLRTMRAAAASAGGHLSLESARPHGLTVRAVLPIVNRAGPP